MEDRSMSKRLRIKLVNGARKHKSVRYCVIALLAVYFFCRQLLRYGKAEWRQSLVTAVSAVMLAVAVMAPVEIKEQQPSQEGTGEPGGDSLRVISRHGSLDAWKSSGQPAESGVASLVKNDVQQNGQEMSDGDAAAEIAAVNEVGEETEIPADDWLEDEDNGEAGQPSDNEEDENPGTGDSQPEGEDTSTGDAQPGDEDVSTGDSSPEGEDGGAGEPQPGGENNGSGDMPEEDISSGNMGPEDGDISAGDNRPGGEDISGNENRPSDDDTDDGLEEEGDTETYKPTDPRLEIFSRNGGSLVDDIFVAGTGAFYELAVSGSVQVSGGDACDVQSVVCRIGDTEYTAEVRNGMARFDVPENISAVLEMYCMDETGAVSPLVEEYIISESNLPQLEAGVEWREDNAAFVKVSVKDSGEIQSGIRQYSCTLDGSPVEIGNGGEKTEWMGLTENIQSIAGVEFELPLTDKENHELVVTAVDYAGNMAQETFEVTAARDIISVVVPTSFDITLYKGYGEGAEAYVQGDDIVLCNKSDFPVEVSVKQLKINTKSKEDEKGRKKSLNLNLGLLQAGQEEKSIPVADGDNAGVLTFTLAEGREDTDSRQLLSKASEESRVGLIKTPDYAAVRMYGSASYADWKDGDLNVKIVFDFTKAADELTKKSETANE